MEDNSFRDLPGSEIVLPGLADVKAGRRSVNASAVQAAAPRLRRAGMEIASTSEDIPAAHILYGQLCEEFGNAAHSLQRHPRPGDRFLRRSGMRKKRHPHPRTETTAYDFHAA